MKPLKMAGLSRLLLPGVAVGLVVLGLNGCANVPIDVSTQVKTASTRAEHVELASHFEREAAAAEAGAARHLTMAEGYRKGVSLYPRTVIPVLAEHCESIARMQRQLAREYSDLAIAHREIAAKSKH